MSSLSILFWTNLNQTLSLPLYQNCLLSKSPMTLHHKILSFLNPNPFDLSIHRKFDKAFDSFDLETLYLWTFLPSASLERPLSSFITRYCSSSVPLTLILPYETNSLHIASNLRLYMLSICCRFQFSYTFHSALNSRFIYLVVNWHLCFTMSKKALKNVFNPTQSSPSPL